MKCGENGKRRICNIICSQRCSVRQKWPLFSDFALFRFNRMIAIYPLFGWPQKACMACVQIFFHEQGFRL